MDTFYHATQLPLFVLSKVCTTIQVRASRRKYYLAHPEQHTNFTKEQKALQSKRERWAQNPEREREKSRLHYAKHAESRREQNRQWKRISNPLMNNAISVKGLVFWER